MQSGVFQWKVQFHKLICPALGNTNRTEDLSKIEIQHRWKQAWFVCNHDLKTTHGQNENGTKMEKKKGKKSLIFKPSTEPFPTEQRTVIESGLWPSFSETQGADRIL